MAELYKTEIASYQTNLQETTNYLSSLDESKEMLENDLKIARKYLVKLKGSSNSTSSLQDNFLQKVSQINALYDTRAQGPDKKEVLSENVAQSILASLDIQQHDIDNLREKRLYQLFARSLELPFYLQKEGKDNLQEYIAQTKKLSEIFEYRIREDVFSLGMGIGILKDQEVDVQALLQKVNGELGALSKNRDNFSQVNSVSELQSLEAVLLKYGYSKTTDQKLLKELLSQSPQGLLGLYIGSLAHPITSWNDASSPARHIYVKDLVSNKAELSYCVVDTLQSALGRYLNKVLLDTVVSKLEQKVVVLSVESNLVDF